MEAPTIPLETAAELSGIHPTSSSSSEIRVTRVPNEDIDKTFARTTNLASSALNALILSRSNDFFAAAENLLTPTAPVHKPGVFVHTGAWYDGWETRRHNPAPYDWVVIKLGVSSGSIEGVEIDTAYFVGNYGEKAELQGTNSNEGGVGLSDDEIASPDYKNWKTILPIVECGPSQRRAWKVERIQNAAAPAPTYTHVRLLMYPDGGFARLRLYGHAIPSSPAIDPSSTAIERKEEEEELSSALVGGLCLSASDQHYTPASNVILPGRGKDMGDGWETARSRTPGHVDWAIFRLGLVGTVHKIVVDTKDFRGNYPREVRVHGINLSKATTTTTTTTTATHGKDEELHLTNDHPGWIELLSGAKKTEADTEHVYEGADLAAGPNDERVFTHVKLTLIPDGGVKRFRIFGKRAM